MFFEKDPPPGRPITHSAPHRTCTQRHTNIWDLTNPGLERQLLRIRSLALGLRAFGRASFPEGTVCRSSRHGGEDEGAGGIIYVSEREGGHVRKDGGVANGEN